MQNKSTLKPSGSALDHLRNHRMGKPSKIASDAELRAFVEARLPHMTFAQIVDAIEAHFPPDRCVSLSSVHRWWQKVKPEVESVSRDR